MHRQILTAATLLGLALFSVTSWSADSAAPARKPLPAAPAASDPTAAPQLPKLDPPTQEWRSDPACQMVFFAVLEGLYTDGVPDEAVDLIVPPKTDLDNNVKQCFVFRCPLCHAAYEAFVLYQHRPAFNGTNEPKSTFGKNFDPAVIEQLKSKDIRTRVYAMGTLMRPWIEKRMNTLHMNDKDQKALLTKLIDYAGPGDQLFRSYKHDPKSVYAQWMFYGGCQACEAIEHVARKMPPAAINAAPAQK